MLSFTKYVFLFAALCLSIAQPGYAAPLINEKNQISNDLLQAEIFDNGTTQDVLNLANNDQLTMLRFDYTPESTNTVADVFTMDFKIWQQQDVRLLFFSEPREDESPMYAYARKTGSLWAAQAFIDWVVDPVNRSWLGKTPVQLNFAAFGDLTIATATGKTYVIKNFVIGQDGKKKSLTWWLGGRSCCYTQNAVATDYMVCKAEDYTNIKFTPELKKEGKKYVNLAKVEIMESDSQQ